MRILFYHPSSHSDGYPEPHMGIGYLMGIAKDKGFEYDYYDHDHHRDQFSVDDVIEKLKPEVYAVSFMTPQYGAAVRAIKKFKKANPKAIVIVGGPHPSAVPEDTIREVPEIDYLCKGEGEHTFEDFLDYLEGNKSVDDVQGLYFFRDGEVVANDRRSLMPRKELDEYEADWDTILKHGPYIQKLVYEEQPVKALAVITTRGCPYACTFCDEASIWERKVRTKAIDLVIAEMKYLRDKFDTWHFNILDDTFTLNPKRVKDFCKKAAELGVTWRVTAKVNNVSKEMVEDMKAGGCKLVAFGVESGDEEVLTIMKKEQTLDEVRTAFKLTQEAGMLTFALCMVGNIGEDFEAVKRTARFVGEMDPDMFSCSIMTPFPGSENYEICERNGWILHRNWDQWCPSVLKMREYKPVSRTDKMEGQDMLRAYYYMNRYVLYRRYSRKYGKLFPARWSFYRNEVLPRMKTIGPASFLKHLAKIHLGDREVPFADVLQKEDPASWPAAQEEAIVKASSRGNSNLLGGSSAMKKAEPAPRKRGLPMVS